MARPARPERPTYRITTHRDAPIEPGLLAVMKSHGQALAEYRTQPEHKFHGPHGTPRRPATHGDCTAAPPTPPGRSGQVKSG